LEGEDTDPAWRNTMAERHLEVESVRLATFGEWPLNAPVSAEDLVENGFFATGNWLEAECHFCHVRIDRWDYGDLVADRHRRSSPICSMVLAPNHCGNVRRTQENDQEGNSVVDSPASCACPDLLLEANRLETFKDWPVSSLPWLPLILQSLLAGDSPKRALFITVEL